MSYLILFLFSMFILVDGNLAPDDDARYKVMDRNLIRSEDIITDDKYIHLAVIIANVNVKDMVPGIILVFTEFLHSLISSSQGTPIHLILITDQQSKLKVEDTIIQTLGRYLSESVIKWEFYQQQDVKLKFPILRIEFVDISSIVEPNRAAIDEMKKIYSLNVKEKIDIQVNETFIAVISPKYSQDLFFMGPFYPTAFPSLDRLMVFDADLQVKEDLAYLEDFFEKMHKEEIIGLVADQAGYYKAMADKLIQEELLTIEDAERRQGINTGVVLYNLEKMRLSKNYQEELNPVNYRLLSDHFNISQQVVGDQEWFNMLTWKYPEMFQILPCEYNFQESALNEILNTKYAPCTVEPKIVHVHGKIHGN